MSDEIDMAELHRLAAEADISFEPSGTRGHYDVFHGGRLVREDVDLLAVEDYVRY